MALTFDVGMNERAAVQSAKNLTKALEGVDTSLDDLAKAQGVDKLEGSFKDLAREADNTGDKIGTSFEKGFDKAKRGVDDFKQEANSTAREAAASFDGSAESIGDAIQEVTANAFGGFGPAGAAAGIAAAAGIGLAISGFQAIEEERQASLERIQEWADQFIEAGGRVLSADQLRSNISDLIKDQDRLTEASKISAAAGIDQGVAIAAMAGDLEAARAVTEALTGRQNEFSAAATGGKVVIAEQRAELNAGIAAWDKNTAEVEAGTNSYTLFQAAVGASNADLLTLKGQLDAMPTNKNVTFTADAGAIYRAMRDWENWQPNPKTGVIMAQVPRGINQLG